MGLAYFVVGPESSGTRMMCEVLIRSTGAEGSYEDGQPFDDLSFTGHAKTIVFRRSVPHGAIWYNLDDLYQMMWMAGYRVFILATLRKPQYLVPSQLKHRHVQSEADAITNIKIAEETINQFCYRKPHLFIQYEEFVTEPKYRANVYRKLRIQPPEMEFYDGNAKYGQGASLA